MNEVEEYYLQHHGVKGMKWGVRKNRKSKLPNKGNSRSSKSANKQEVKKAKKVNKALRKEAKGDIYSWARAKNSYNPKRISEANKNIDRKRANNKGYDQAYEKARKSYNRTGRAVQIGALAHMGLAVASITHPEAVAKGASVVGAVLGSAASTTGMYAKYAAKAAVPVSRTVKNRGYIQAILVNSGNAVGFPG